MKNLFYILALSLSIFLAACSSNDQEMAPLSPQLEKAPVNDIKTPYPYLLSFHEVKNLKVEYFGVKEGIVLVVHSSLPTLKHLYAVTDQLAIETSSLVFLGNANEGKYLIKGFNTDIKNIRIYGVPNSNATDSDTKPFPNSTVINRIPLKGWSASESYIKVSSTRFPTGLKYLFAEMKTKKGNIVVFLSKPTAEDFAIPKYGALGIMELNLFGYTTKFAEN